MIRLDQSFQKQKMKVIFKIVVKSRYQTALEMFWKVIKGAVMSWKALKGSKRSSRAMKHANIKRFPFFKGRKKRENIGEYSGTSHALPVNNQTNCVANIHA